MEAKYYTPERNEFHEGFVFEANYKKEGWQKEIFGIGERSISSVPQLLYQFLDGAPLEGNIRVKLLDREDIESCDWEEDTSSGDFTMFHLKNGDKYDYSLAFNGGYKRTENYRVTIKYYDETLFKGTVLNKSQLKSLMQMLNIK